MPVSKSNLKRFRKYGTTKIDFNIGLKEVHTISKRKGN